MEDYPRVRFAVIGMGWIGKRHSNLIISNADAELVAYCDLQECLSLGTDYDGIPFFKSPEELYQSGLSIDVVSICTPNGFHAAHCTQALSFGINVVCEKPMALTVSDAKSMIDASEKYGKTIFCVMQNRYSAPSRWLKQMLESNFLGDIYMVQINCFWNRDERYYTPDSWHGDTKLDGGTLFTQFSHFIDTLFWLFGDIANIYSRFSDFAHHDLTDFEDSGMITFDFVNGGMGSVNYSTATWLENLESSITVIAQKGSIKVSGQYMENVEICNVKNYTFSGFDPVKDKKVNHHYLFQNVVDTLRGHAQPDATAYEGMKVVDIIERIYAQK